jgi:hypothetical protein
VPQTLSRELARFVEVQRAQGTRVRAAEALVVGAVTTTVLSLIFGVSIGLLGASGTFVAIMAADRAPVSRARVLARLAGTYLVGVSAGALVAGSNPLLVTVTMAVVATVFSFGYHALLSDPPGPMLLITGAATASYLPSLGVPVGLFIGVSALALLIACAVALLLAALRPREAMTAKMTLLASAVTDLEGADRGSVDPDDLARLRDAAFTALFTAQAALVSSARRHRPDSDYHRDVEGRVIAWHRRLLESVRRDDLPWAQLDLDALATLHYLGGPREGYLLRWAFSLSSPPWLAARRTGLAVLVAGVAATTLSVSHPYWAILTAALVLTAGADRISSTHRAGHRVVGTALGIGVFIAIHALHPGGAVVAVIVVGCIAITHLLAPRQYALASMVLTPMALLMSSIHTPPAALSGLLTNRILDTLIGALAALLVLWSPGANTPIVLVRRQFRRALRALQQAIAVMADGDALTAAGLTARRNLHFEQLAAARVLAMARIDRPQTLAEWPHIEAALGELTYTVLTAAWTTDPDGVLRWAVMDESLRALIADLPPVSSEPIDAVVTAVAVRHLLVLGRPDQWSVGGDCAGDMPTGGVPAD